MDFNAVAIRVTDVLRVTGVPSVWRHHSLPPKIPIPVWQRGQVWGW
jgi:hypothetical protein